MNKSELVAAVAESAELTNAQAAAAVAAVIEAVTGAVKTGDKVVIPGFLTVEVTDRAARTGRNPATGAPLEIAASKGVKISAGSTLKAAAKS